MEESIFAKAPHEGETPEELFNPTVDKELEVEKPAESQSEKEEPDLKQNEAWKEIREAKEQAEAKALELEQRLQALESGNKEVERSEFVTSLVGDNEEIDRKWQKERETIKEEVKKELVQEQIKAQQIEKDEQNYWNKWTQDQFDSVEKEFKVDFKSAPTLKNELAKVMTDYTPTDSNGNLDYSKGMKLLNDLKKSQVEEESQKTQVKKNIADATISKETSTKETKNFLTRNDLRGGWRAIVNRE